MQILEPSPKNAAGLVTRSSDTRRIGSHVSPDDPRWQLARRITASRTLGRSRLLSDFLLYIVDRHICDREEEITEQQIGVLVFGRAEGYDSNDDNIVRSYARNLRKRVDEYFATEGKEEALLLDIPRGGYAPTFSHRTISTHIQHGSLVASGATPSLTDNEEDSPPNSTETPHTAAETAWAPPPSEETTPLFINRDPLENRLRQRNYRAILMLCIGIALGLSLSFMQPLRLLKRASASPAKAASHRLWSQLFSNDRDTFIVPSDDGLIIMQELTERPVPLASYINGSYRTSIKRDDVPGALEMIKLGGRRYTSVADLEFVAQLAQLDEIVPERMMIRYARDLRMEDLRAGNAILIGSEEANPWTEIFRPQLNFRFSINPGSDMPSGIVNLHPRIGEEAIYGTPGANHTYGLIAYVPNLTSTGHVLIVAGLNTAGTEAAATFLLTPSLMMPTLQRARAANGGLRTFELLIGAGNIAMNASTPQRVLERIGSS